ncbi:hypothetical protein KY345_04920 [Candidatus Woesearchaeota archaeon]|nr:hypothetical protein [Candidatus Woesearchaeota archaeon]
MKKPKYKKEWGMVHKEEKKKRITKEFIWTVAIAFILVSSIIGFMWVGGEPEFTYNNHKFIRINNAFVYEQNGEQFSFRFFPTELEQLANQSKLSNLKKPVIYVTFDPEIELIQSIDIVRFELANDLPRLRTYLVQAVTNEGDIYDLPVMDCENATVNNPIIRFEKANHTEIIEENNCFLFRAKNDYDIARLKDVLMYVLLGVF